MFSRGFYLKPIDERLNLSDKWWIRSEISTGGAGVVVPVEKVIVGMECLFILMH